MKQLLIFRIFASFPLIGIVIPDIAGKFDRLASPIPAAHVIVEITLVICIVICSAGIFIIENSKIKHPQKQTPVLETI